MRDFMKFCDAAGLDWYLAFGASIGAVRHKGLIPWDDDIDVYMPRPDYERLLNDYERDIRRTKSSLIQQKKTLLNKQGR